jgi:hypothetical protein
MGTRTLERLKVIIYCYSGEIEPSIIILLRVLDHYDGLHNVSYRYYREMGHFFINFLKGTEGSKLQL